MRKLNRDNLAVLPANASRLTARQMAAEGFTLIELLITIILVAVLTAIALPSFLNTAVKAKAVGAKQGIHAILLKAYVGVRSGDIQRNQLRAAPPEERDGKFTYYGSLEENDLFVVEAEPLDDSTLLGKSLVGCIELDTGRITMQRDFDAPLDGCGGQGQGQGQGQGRRGGR